VIRLTAERILQSLIVEPRDAIDDDGIERSGGRGIVIVRQIGAGDEQRLAAAQHGGQRVAEQPRGFRGLAAHHERDDRQTGREVREKRQLHFERVLADVGGRLLMNHRRRVQQGARAAGVDRHDAERRLESAGRIDGHTLEGDEVRRSDEDRNVERASAQQPVGVRGDRAGVHQPGVRRDERGQIAGDEVVPRRAGKVAIHFRGQRRRRSRIPRARNRGFSDVAHHG
jgi:hypothetical protein